MQVLMSDCFKEVYPKFDDEIRQAVARFIDHTESYGIKGLQGRNKPSIPSNLHTKKQLKNAKFAQKYCLWHYHLGIPEYIKQENGDLTSEYILHYCYYDDLIVLVDIASHPPFELPSVEKMEYS
ncbi:hypothetical protein LU290_07565 [Moraxella nasibovis]|uniref:hypothetical protein n=1 Tax=Moraxella nasibovis TaxID=2904120 RepID=UPI0024100957|nr:hypothetical protein [Moraxella nasibovis]WFF38112.1 hypothetical protein LU290_07565 [Moraxella nasibovis]